MNLKFELQFLKDTAKEKAEQEKLSHEVLARQELEDSFCEKPLTTSEAGGLVSPVASSKASNTDAVYFKVSLARVDELWFKSLNRT